MITSLPLDRVVELHPQPEPPPRHHYWVAPFGMLIPFLQFVPKFFL